MAITKVPIKIIINGRDHNLRLGNKKEISYFDLTQLAFPGSIGNPSLKYSHGGILGNEQGIMNNGQKIKIRNGMVFNIIFTGNA